MHLDIRLPMGLLFLIIGFILVGYGSSVDPVIYARRSIGNVNVGWGAVFMVFGALLLWLTRRARLLRRAGAQPESKPRSLER